MRTFVIIVMAAIVLTSGSLYMLKAQAPATAPSDSPHGNPFEGKILVLALKSDAQTTTTIENAELRRTGGRDFLVGTCISTEEQDDWREGLPVWTAVDDISQIVEVPNRKELKQRMQLEDQPADTKGV